jgi:hypothetical protein
VQHYIRSFCSDRPEGPIQVVSMCAGQGRDLIGALRDHPRSGDVRALLVELDDRNVALASSRASEAGLSGFTVRASDAAVSSSYAGSVPADLILACGMLGNIAFPELRSVVEKFLYLSAGGAVVIWTYNRLDPDRTSALREWFVAAGYAETAFEVSSLGPEVVGVNRLTKEPRPFRDGLKMFDFVGYDNLDYDLPDYTR